MTTATFETFHDVWLFSKRELVLIILVYLLAARLSSQKLRNRLALLSVVRVCYTLACSKMRNRTVILLILPPNRVEFKFDSCIFVLFAEISTSVEHGHGKVDPP